MMRSLSWSLCALFAASVSYGQAPYAAYPLKPGVPAKPLPVQQRPAPPVAQVGYGAEVGSGCANCGVRDRGYTGYGPQDFGLGQMGTSMPGFGGGCGCGGGNCSNYPNQVGQPGFVGGCCDYLKPRARGLWNSYCGDKHMHGGHGCGHGCGSVTPIGLYGATPFGCCAAGVNCGCGGGLGLGGHDCGSSCGSGCNNCFGWFSSRGGCGCGVTKPCGWRMGLGGYPCSSDATCGVEPGCASGSSGAAYGGAPAVQPTPAESLPNEVPPPPATEDDTMNAPPLPKSAMKSKLPAWLSPKTAR